MELVDCLFAVAMLMELACLQATASVSLSSVAGTFFKWRSATNIG
jgi:hypothetical protein